MMKVSLTTLLLTLYFASSNLLAESTAREICLTNSKAENRYASYSPGGQKVIFESNREGNWDIYLMAIDGSAQTRLTSDKGDDRRPSWHPNGDKVVFESNRDGVSRLYTLSVNSGDVQQLEMLDSELGTPMFARYSPNGKEIAVSVRESDEKGNIAILESSGSFKRWVTDFDRRSFYSNWSNDGQSLVFHSRMDTDNNDDEIYRWNRADNKLVRLTHWPTHNFCPAWSPDGKRIAYATSMPESRPEIFVMNANGGDRRQITFNQDGETLPSWSPDSTSLLLTAYRGGHYQICSIVLD